MQERTPIPGIVVLGTTRVELHDHLSDSRAKRMRREMLHRTPEQPQ